MYITIIITITITDSSFLEKELEKEESRRHNTS